MRQTWEEIGLDLAERDFTCVGQLDDREITTSLGKRLLMILSPFGTIPEFIKRPRSCPDPGVSPLVQSSSNFHPRLLRLIPSRGRRSTGFQFLPFSLQSGRLFQSTALRDLRPANPCYCDTRFEPLLEK